MNEAILALVQTLESKQSAVLATVIEVSGAVEAGRCDRVTNETWPTHAKISLTYLDD